MKSVLGKLATLVCAAALLFVVLAIIVPWVLGLQRYVITGGSMTGTIPKGAMAYARMTAVEDLEVGDIITFHPPHGRVAVTHRIIAIEEGPNGRPAFRTKGDFNDAADPWGAITLNAPQQARYVFHIPYFGYVLAALTIRSVRIAAIALPALIIALSLLWSLWTQAGEEVARQHRVEAEDIPHDAPSRA